MANLNKYTQKLEELGCEEVSNIGIASIYDNEEKGYISMIHDGGICMYKFDSESDVETRQPDTATERLEIGIDNLTVEKIEDFFTGNGEI